MKRILVAGVKYVYKAVRYAEMKPNTIPTHNKKLGKLLPILDSFITLVLKEGKLR